MNNEANRTQTVLKALDALECLAEASTPLSAQEVGQRCGLSRTTAHRLLTTLLSRGYVASSRDGRYGLGPGLLRLSHSLLDHLELPDLAKDELREVARLSNETTYLAVRDGDEVLYIDRVESTQPVRLRSIVGTRNPLHCTSLGKAILAFLPDGERATLLDRVAFVRRTPNTITDRAALEEQLALIRTRGFAIDDVENEEDVRCVSAPIFDSGGHTVAAISVSGPAFRLSIDRCVELAAVVRQAADAISCKLGFVAPERVAGRDGNGAAVPAGEAAG